MNLLATKIDNIWADLDIGGDLYTYSALFFHGRAKEEYRSEPNYVQAIINNNLEVINTTHGTVDYTYHHPNDSHINVKGNWFLSARSFHNSYNQILVVGD